MKLKIVFVLIALIMVSCGKLGDKASSALEAVSDLGSDGANNFIQTGTHIDFAKVDIEGAEYQFWKGSVRVRKENPHMVFLLEFNAARYKEPGKFIENILDEGYSLKRLHKNAEIKRITKFEALEQAKHQDIMLLIEPKV